MEFVEPRCDVWLKIRHAAAFWVIWCGLTAQAGRSDTGGHCSQGKTTKVCSRSCVACWVSYSLISLILNRENKEKAQPSCRSNVINKDQLVISHYTRFLAVYLNDVVMYGFLGWEGSSVDLYWLAPYVVMKD